MNAYDDKDDGYGPPCDEDSAWYTHFVVSLDYPKLKRGPKLMKGQTSFSEFQPAPSTRPQGP